MGGQGSGNFGHAGRPGRIGGSGSGGGGASERARQERHALERQRKAEKELEAEREEFEPFFNDQEDMQQLRNAERSQTDAPSALAPHTRETLNTLVQDIKGKGTAQREFLDLDTGEKITTFSGRQDRIGEVRTSKDFPPNFQVLERFLASPARVLTLVTPRGNYTIEIPKGMEKAERQALLTTMKQIALERQDPSQRLRESKSSVYLLTNRDWRWLAVKSPLKYTSP